MGKYQVAVVQNKALQQGKPEESASSAGKAEAPEKVSAQEASGAFDRNIRSQVRQVMELLGGMGRFVKPGQRVLMKPNLTGPAAWEKGVTTNPALLEALIELALEAGAAKVDVGDGTGSIHIGTRKVMERCKIADKARRLGAELLDLNVGPMELLKVENGRILESVKVNRACLEYDVVINIPVLKTHFITEVSLGMKNLKGCIPPVEKRRFHDIGVNQAVADLNRVFQTSLTVVDGIIGSEGLGPKEGKPVGMGVILAGENVLAVDMAAASIMGFEPEKIEHIRMAMEDGIGPSGIGEVEILGDSIEKVSRSFQRAVPSMPDKGQAKIHNFGACSGCIGCAAITISRLEDMGFFAEDPERRVEIVIGTRIPKDGSWRNGFFMGNCAQAMAEGRRFIRGCAPSALDAANEILRCFQIEESPDV